jgi:hypothetical protein
LICVDDIREKTKGTAVKQEEMLWEDFIGTWHYMLVSSSDCESLIPAGVCRIRSLCETFLEEFPAIDVNDPVTPVRQFCEIILNELRRMKEKKP